MKQLSFFDKVSYGFGDLASNVVFTAVGTYLMFFYTDVFGISAAVVGTLFFVTRMWDAVSDPIMGMIGDRTRSRFGKFRPYLLYVPIPLAIVAILTFTTPDLSESNKVIWAFATYILLMTLYTAINIPYSSLPATMSDSPVERGQMASFRMVLAFSGALLVNAGTLPLVTFFGGEDQQQGFQYTMMLLSAIMVVMFWLCFARVKERVPMVKQSSSVKQDFAVVVKNRAWWITILMGVPMFTFGLMPFAVGMYYFTYNVGDVSAAGTFFTCATLGMIVGAIIMSQLVKRFAKRSLIMAAALSSMCFIGSLYWVDPANLTMIYVIIFFNQLTKGVAASCLWGVVADTADYVEWKSGRRVVGLSTSSATFSHKFGMGLSGAIVGAGLSYAGYQAGVEQTDAAKNMITIFMSLLPAFGAACIVVIAFFYPINAEVEVTMQEGLRKARKANADGHKG
ncbi:MFS transporter [Marinomonas posidonica]|uniref:Sugar (Glycoside-Pentoside-Hexuronide) transporter n=1 Tax=Marinomonas posidonica (strain CECT 7376 / NCIMB 14433 / IVIA-Po-181) TaxID=491952 RepID=F6CU91_MARPP|nr:MFS transporter [Marinomonas posidonica]AEF55210.1 sugar (Glycoside-Pentoside-Hexuronide) transporter [Marinomonas posidonica IVIA-Po-181]